MRTFSIITVPLIFVYCYFWMVFGVFANESRSNWATDAYQKNCNSVIFIQGDKVEGRRGGTYESDRTFNGMGSGVIIDERGYIITNYHVVKDIRNIQVKTYDQKDYTAELVAKDSDTDLAIIKINAKTPLQPITFGRSHDLMPCESCLAIGNPYGYFSSLTDGRISAVNREVGVNDSPLVYRSAIQTNAAINPGNSGGPLINIEGEMIGINVAIRQGSNAIAFASPVDQVVEVAAKLIGEIVNQKISLGITVSQNEPTDYSRFKRFIVKVESVENNSQAAQSGIKQGDILVGIGKYTVRNKLDFYRALLDLRANDDIAFNIYRNNELQDINVAIGGTTNSAFARQSIAPRPSATAPKSASHAVSQSNSPAEWDRILWDNLGIQYVAIPAHEFDQKYQNFLGKFSGGVVVKAVRTGSPAEQASFTVGDVIVGMGQWETTSTNDMRWIASKWSNLLAENERLHAEVIREGTHYAADIPLK